MIFIEPWESLSSNQATAFILELAAELSHEHPLHGIEFHAVAHSCRVDDALFGMNDGRVVAVHLTWGGAPERPPFPVHRIYSSLEDWAQQLMLPKPTDPSG